MIIQRPQALTVCMSSFFLGQVHTSKGEIEADESDILLEPTHKPPGKFIRMEGSLDRKPSSAGSAYATSPGGEGTPAYVEKAAAQQKLLNEVWCSWPTPLHEVW